MNFAAATSDMQRLLLQELGEPPGTVAFLPVGKAPVTVSAETGEPLVGIFSDPHKAFDLSTGSLVSSREVTFDLRLVDLAPYVPRADHDFVVVRGKKWSFSDVRPDGEGMVTLVLTSPQPYG